MATARTTAEQGSIHAYETSRHAVQLHVPRRHGPPDDQARLREPRRVSRETLAGDFERYLAARKQYLDPAHVQRQEHRPSRPGSTASNANTDTPLTCTTTRDADHLIPRPHLFRLPLGRERC